MTPDLGLAVLGLPAGEVVLLPSQRFGIPDWEAFWAGPCGHATPSGAWIEFIGGDRTMTGEDTGS